MRVPLLQSTQSGFQWVADRVWKVEHAFERVNAAGAKAQSARIRIFGLLCFLAFGYVCLAFFDTRASLFAGKDQVAALAADPHLRGQLVDRNGALLATDVNEYSLFVNPKDMTAADRPFMKRALAHIFPGLKPAQIDNALAGPKPVQLITRLTEAQREQILNYGLPGLRFEASRVREYPLGTTGSAYIGMTQRGGGGLSGVEKSLQTDIIAAGQVNQAVPLAMDLRVQGALENELRAAAQDQNAHAAIGIVTNVRTGEILGMASWPDFDLNNPGNYSDEERRNHAANDVYELGSIFKVISIAIGLDSGTASVNSTYDGRQPLQLGNRLIHDDHQTTDGLMSLQDVFIKSSNIGTSRVALDVGVPTMTNYYKQLGLMGPADVPLTGLASPILPSRWTQDSLVSSAFGQAWAMSPLSYVEAASAVLNGGCMRPLSVKKYDGKSAVPCAHVFKPETTQVMMDMMRQNVLKGTGKFANVPGLRVGGKTGTGQKPDKGHYTAARFSSFAAVFPTDAPVDGDKYLVLISLDSPQGSAKSLGQKTGAYVAAPAAGHVIERIAPFLGVLRKEDKFTDPQWDKATAGSADMMGDEH